MTRNMQLPFMSLRQYTEKASFSRLFTSYNIIFRIKLCFSPHDWAFRVPKENCKYAKLTLGLQDSLGVSIRRKVDLQVTPSMKKP